jgi:hypothetical protein
MRLSWAVMVNHLQVSHQSVDCSIHHNGSHDYGLGMCSSTTVHPKKPTQSHKQIVCAMVVGTEIMDQAVQESVFCATQTLET